MVKIYRYLILIFDMIHVGPVTHSAPAAFSTPLQQKIYETLASLQVPFSRVDNDPSHTMEDAVAINASLGGHMAKNVLLTNRQGTRYWLLVMSADKSFITRDFCAAMGGIPRVSFAPAEKLQQLLGVEYGAANILCTLMPPAAPDPAAGTPYTLVIDREVTGSDSFMCPDGTTTSHLKIATADLLGSILPATGFQPLFIDLP